MTDESGCWEYNTGKPVSYPDSIPPPGFHLREITHEAATLLPLIPEGRDFVGVEVGVYLAKTASILLWRRQHLFLYLVDSYEVLPETKQVSERHLADVDGARGRWRILHGDSTAMAVEVEDASVDYVFIDASKEPGKYRADCEAWLPKIKPGGFMAGHDLYHAHIEDIVRALFPGQDYHPDPKRKSWWVRL